MEGLDLDPNAKETKLFNAVVDLLDDLCLSVEEMEDAYDELSGQVDEIDEDLGELEEAYYELAISSMTKSSIKLVLDTAGSFLMISSSRISRRAAAAPA